MGIVRVWLLRGALQVSWTFYFLTLRAHVACGHVSSRWQSHLGAQERKQPALLELEQRSQDALL